jgi:cobalt-zinc-cadmium efflux system membrane fusion protein
MSRTNQEPAARPFRRGAGLGLGALLTVAVGWLLAHEGHVALPSRGAQVDLAKGHLILTKESRDALDVQSAELVRQPLPEVVLTTATLEAPWGQHAFASARLAGKIVKLAVQPGEVVKGGQILAEVASQDLEKFQAEILNLQNDEQLARQRVESLEANSLVPEQTILDARTNLLQAKNALLLARVKWRGLDLKEKALDDLLASGGKRRVAALPVRSPIAGTVIHADLNVGKVAEPGEHLFEIVDLTRVWARLGVLEADIDRVQVGQVVELSLTAYPGEVFRTRVMGRGLMLDPHTHLMSVWAELENPSGEPRLLPGMSGQARILLPPADKTWTIPADALIDNGVEQYVLVEEASTAAVSEYHKRAVVVVNRSSNRVEVRSPDLLPGDRVAVRGAHELGGFFIPGVLKPGPEARATWKLATAPVEEHAVEEVFEVAGQVDIPPDRRAVASAQVGGNILRLRVERGQTVTSGQLLAQVVSQEFLALQLELLRESLALDLVEQQYQRLQKAVGVVPQRKLIDLEAARSAGRNRVESLRNRLGSLGLTADQLSALVEKQRVVEALPVRSPIAGSVVDFARVVGQVVRPDEPLVEIHDLTSPLIVGFVTERDLARVRVGQSARVRLVSNPETILPATVVRSSRVFLDGDQTLSVWVRPTLPRGAILWHRQLARLTLTVGTGRPTLAVPLTSLGYEGTRPFVFVRLPDETFERRQVVLGRSDDNFAEIVDGLRRSEVVAVSGVAGLQTAFASVR